MRSGDHRVSTPATTSLLICGSVFISWCLLSVCEPEGERKLKSMFMNKPALGPLLAQDLTYQSALCFPVASSCPRASSEPLGAALKGVREGQHLFSMRSCGCPWLHTSTGWKPTTTPIILSQGRTRQALSLLAASGPIPVKTVYPSLGPSSFLAGALGTNQRKRLLLPSPNPQEQPASLRTHSSHVHGNSPSSTPVPDQAEAI